MSTPLKPWPYILLAPEPMVRIIKSQKTDIDSTENPLSAFVQPKALKSLFNQQDLARLYWLNTSDDVSINASLTTRPEFFTTFWGEEMCEECKTLSAALNSSIDKSAVNQPLPYVNKTLSLETLVCQIPTNLKPTQEKDALVLPESIIIIPLKEEMIQSLGVGSTNLSQKLNDNAVSLAIVTAVLQALYKLYSVEQVSNHPWFGHYVRMV